MNAFTKVLVILVLVLSIGFAASQIILYGKRVKLNTALAQANSQLSQVTSQKNDLDKQLSDLKAGTDRTIADLKNQNQDLDSKLKDAGQNIASLQNDSAQKQASITSLSANTKTLGDTINQKDAALAQADKDKDDLTKQVQDKVTQLAQVTTQLKDSEAKAGDLTQQLTESKKQNVKLADANETMSSQLADLVKRGFNIEPAAAPPINAKVLTVNSQLNTAVINKGSESGVQKNTEFTIYRDSTYVARMIITDVDKQVAAGRVTILAKGQEPQQGDDATTTIR
jgi:peptidoglycan hydrolase CwlO-like protein